jgi:hypothetical protein
MSQETTIKLTISIDQQRVGYYGRGEMTITDMMFSESRYKLMDAEELITEVKQCIKLMKGWSMITITLTDDIEYTSYPKRISEVRFINRYGDIEMSYADGNYFSNWKPAKIKELYENIRTFIKNANILQLGKLKQSASTEVAIA